ncbi:hypothetical protein FRC12_007342 [Ceratobasidium sp. 428]|nr:hypothetical protein FRC12_007342 [Ceratobasidium sp. 428]
MSNQPPTLEETRRRIAIRHLDQLSKHELVLPDKEPVFDGAFLQVLEKWSDTSKTTIENAVKNQHDGVWSSPINWSYTFLAFMESMATYLRDWSLVVKAVELYRQGKIEEALQKLKDSTAEIEKLANKWQMDFQVLCDFVHVCRFALVCLGSALNTKRLSRRHQRNTPNGTAHTAEHSFPGTLALPLSELDSRFGIHWASNAFDKLTPTNYKGTNPTNIKDWIVDLNFQPQQAAAGTLYSTHVSEGAYNGLFGDFSGGTPFGMISHHL